MICVYKYNTIERRIQIFFRLLTMNVGMPAVQYDAVYYTHSPKQKSFSLPALLNPLLYFRAAISPEHLRSPLFLGHINL
jgi:hypothetical protein